MLSSLESLWYCLLKIIQPKTDTFFLCSFLTLWLPVSNISFISNLMLVFKLNIPWKNCLVVFIFHREDIPLLPYAVLFYFELHGGLKKYSACLELEIVKDLIVQMVLILWTYLTMASLHPLVDTSNLPFHQSVKIGPEIGHFKQLNKRFIFLQRSCKPPWDSEAAVNTQYEVVVVKNAGDYWPSFMLYTQKVIKSEP